MKTIKRLGLLVLGLTFIACSNDDSSTEEKPVVITPVEADCDCYYQRIDINQDGDTIYKSAKQYGKNLGTCGKITDIVLPDNNPFLTTHHITNCK